MHGLYPSICRRHFLASAGVLGALSLAGRVGAKPRDSKPNILFILADDLPGAGCTEDDVLAATRRAPDAGVMPTGSAPPPAEASSNCAVCDRPITARAVCCACQPGQPCSP